MIFNNAVTFLKSILQLSGYTHYEYIFTRTINFKFREECIVLYLFKLMLIFLRL